MTFLIDSPSSLFAAGVEWGIYFRLKWNSDTGRMKEGEKLGRGGEMSGSQTKWAETYSYDRQ